MSTRRVAMVRLACLVFAGEAVFSLPFHVPRFFRPALLETAGLTNTTLGDVFAVYGVTAMLAYFPGGALADRFPARGLLAGSLLATAAGGLYLASFPGATGLRWLYGYWGLTTILLFWAALIRATRDWAGPLAQGRAFGILDGGRGLAAAVLASLAVTLLARAGATPDAPLRHVVLFYTATTAGAGLLCWWVLPGGTAPGAGAFPAVARLREICTGRVIWLQAAIVVTAYCGYKGLDYYALYVQQALGRTATAASAWFAATAYLRPLAAIAAGFAADRIGAGRLVTASFLAGAVGYGVLGAGAGPAGVVTATLLLTIAAVYALRGVYFALLQEARVAPALSGTAVGLISVVGYTPDVFFAPIAGRLLDATPGAAGFAHVFTLLGGLFMLGATAAWGLRRHVARAPVLTPPDRRARGLPPC